MPQAAFNFEIKRKKFHLYSLIFPITYFFIAKIWMVCFLLILVAGTLYIDISRHYNAKIKDLTTIFFAKFMRPAEESGSFKLSGASFMALGFFLTALFFSKGLVITAWLILIISDCVAALVGIKIGKPLVNGKSIEGAVAFFGSAILISMLCYFYVGYSTSFMVIMISCFIATLCEFYATQIHIDDNLLIPLSYCFSTSLLDFIAGL